ncbi:hypothetical protein [Psychroflexus lacisalsi]|jgi:hypothetical protein|uniref:Lipoprotein n=1 Tax=Psychroflexus lacisalsi TaxID=503928 RepID=A0ABP3VKV1_9FLAO|nr:hypothetical protein [Psychroflexus lacisalsi]MBZ9620080.1 hypothetical protein [Psychroflexus lacisalsi]
MIYKSLLILLVLTGCKSSQTDLPVLQNCPGNGDCEVQVFKETKLLLKEKSSEISDVFFEEDKDFQVIFIKYKDSKKKDYTEEIYLQIPSRFREIHSKNYSLNNQKVVFGKICNCEESGFKYVNQGELVILNNKETISLHLEIKSEKKQVIQIIDLEI